MIKCEHCKIKKGIPELIPNEKIELKLVHICDICFKKYKVAMEV